MPEKESTPEVEEPMTVPFLMVTEGAAARSSIGAVAARLTSSGSKTKVYIIACLTTRRVLEIEEMFGQLELPMEGLGVPIRNSYSLHASELGIYVVNQNGHVLVPL